MPGCIGTTFCGGLNYPRGKKENAIHVPLVSGAKKLLVGDEDWIQKFYLNTEILANMITKSTREKALVINIQIPELLVNFLKVKSWSITMSWAPLLQISK